MANPFKRIDADEAAKSAPAPKAEDKPNKPRVTRGRWMERNRDQRDSDGYEAGEGTKRSSNVTPSKFLSEY